MRCNNTKVARRPRKVRRLNAGKEVRAIARERVGTVPPSKVILSKRKKSPKHKDELEEDME